MLGGRSESETRMTGRVGGADALLPLPHGLHGDDELFFKHKAVLKDVTVPARVPDGSGVWAAQGGQASAAHTSSLVEACLLEQPELKDAWMSLADLEARPEAGRCLVFATRVRICVAFCVGEGAS